MSLCINPRCPKPENDDLNVFCNACGSELRLEGRYQVIRLLGSGGFGNTYEVRHGGTPKVLKILQLDNIPPASRPKVLSLFQQEAKVLKLLDHPGIPKGDRYFEFLPRNSQEPLHCLVMQKIEGVDLQEYLTQRGRPIDGELAVEWMRRLTEILAQVHSQNFFHRDIKPSNIMFQPSCELALIDFGTAREVTGTYHVKQPMGMVTGIASFGYTPPEQLNGQAVLQSDFFALGRTFVYLLTGKEPNDPDLYDAINDQLHWRDYVQDVSPALANLIDRLMARVANQRPANTQEILQQLAGIERSMRSTTAPTVPVQSVQSTIPSNKATPRVVQRRSTAPAGPWQKAQLERTLKGHSYSVRSVAISPDGETLASGSGGDFNGILKLWHLSFGQEICTIRGHSNAVNSVAISPDGQILVSGSDDKTIKLWNLHTREEIRILRGHSGWFAGVNSVAISPDGKTLASGSSDKTIKLWNLSTGQEICTLTGHSKAVRSVAISPDGQILVSGSDDKTIKLWNLHTRENIGILKHSGLIAGVNSVAIGPDGQTLASGSEDDTIKLWNLSTGQEICTLRGHSNSVTFVAFSPDGQTLASGSEDDTIKLWNLSTGQEICTLRGHSDHSDLPSVNLRPVLTVTFSPDGQTLVSGSWDGTINIWRRV